MHRFVKITKNAISVNHSFSTSNIEPNNAQFRLFFYVEKLINDNNMIAISYENTLEHRMGVTVMDYLRLFVYVLLMLAGFILLAKGSGIFVDGAIGIARSFGISEMTIGLTVVAMGTSIPEAAVSFTAAFEGDDEITVGNIVGSNILNILIILGIASIIVPLTVKVNTIKYEIPFMLLVTLLLLFLGYDGNISMIDGLILWGAFIVYLAYLFLNSKNKNSSETSTEIKGWKQLLYSVVGIIMVIAGSELTVYSATESAMYLGVSERIIGLTIVALGTSLPELFTSIVAAMKGNEDIAIGNIVGSNIFNILFIIGTAALVSDVPFESQFILDTVVAVVAGVVLFAFAISKRKLTRLSGVFMLLSYCLYFSYICFM